MKSLSVLVVVLMTIAASAAETVKIQTPRGTEVTVTLHTPQGKNLPVLLVAPGQGCNSKSTLFETLGTKGFQKNFAMIRFEWGYCGTADGKPSTGLKDEIEDMVTVLEFTKKQTSVDPSKIVLAGKSMGSSVAYRIFSQRRELKAIVLLTPICSHTTDENDNPLPQPLSVCDKNYPRLKEDPRPVLMTMGNQDAACLLPVLYDFLKDSKGNVQTFVAGGDHGFRIYDEKGSVDPMKTQNNIETVVNVLLNWSGLIF